MSGELVPFRTSVTAGKLVDADVWTTYANIAQTVAGTEFVKRAIRGNAPAVLSCILYGHDLGIPPLVALREIDVVDGRPAPGANLVTARIREAGHSLSWSYIFDGEGNEIGCTASGVRADNGDVGEYTFTLVKAQRAGLLGKGAWKSYPESMLWARAVTQLARMLFADVFLGGVYTPEELGADTSSAVEAPSRVASPREASGPADNTGPATADTSSVGEPQAPGGVSEPDAIEAPSSAEVPGYARAFLVDGGAGVPMLPAIALRWQESDGASLITDVKAHDYDLTTLVFLADMEARRLQKSGKPGARQTVLHALHKRMVALGWRSPELGGGGPEAAEEGDNPSPPPAAEPPLPEALQPAPPLDRFLALFAGDSVLPDWLTVEAVLREAGRIDNATYGGLMDIPDDTLAQVWALVPEEVRSLVEGLPADNFQEELIV